MLRAFHRRWLLLVITVVVVTALAVVTFHEWEEYNAQRVGVPSAKTEAPPDLQKYRDRYGAGVGAILRNDGSEGIRHLSSFTFGPRAVEEYRLYYLASGYQLTSQFAKARVTLTKLFNRRPKLVYAVEAGFDLASLHRDAGSFEQAANVLKEVAARAESPNIAAAARWNSVEASLASGDVAGALEAARQIVIRSPRAPQVAHALAIVRSLSGLPPYAAIPLTPAERMERAVSLLRDGDPKSALFELTALDPVAPASLELPIQLNRGLALFQQRRLEEANDVLEPITSGPYKYAIPALYHLAQSYRALGAAIDPMVKKTITEKKQVGTVKVKVGKGKKRRTVTKPKFANVKRTIELIDLAKKEKKETYERLHVERLKDLLQLPLSDEVRLEVLNVLIELAEAKNQDEYEQELVREVVKIDPLQDPGLQHFWNKAWGAYERGDVATAAPILRFIADTYTNTNVKRQSEYWFARSIERQGRKEEADAIYRKLAEAPYEDVYALHAVSRGAKHVDNTSNPLKKSGPDWREIAEKEMPDELRLAYELTALSDYRDARFEIQRNMKRENTRFAEALLADLYHSTNNPILMYKSIRRAFPDLATVDQDSVPVYFLKMYYPLRHQDHIRKYSERHGVDPYLVMGLILQESYYDPRAKSPVGATGLMQLMPPTAKQHAQRLRVPFGATRLENPEVNIQLGTYHLKMLMDMFRGNTYLVVASYNGGQGNVLKWRRAAPNKPLDEFLESIPFPETRNYVKRLTILRSSYERIAG